MRHASIFSGIGGFDLAAEWMGWENVFHCEINTFCQRILKYYWPNATSYTDIKSTDFTIHRGSVDILTGGFPCQPYSTAGKRLGKEDDRHLWPEMLRAIREIQPAWVVGENVRGLTNWNAGLVFDEVQSDLEAIGYEVTPFILPACAVNAPHRRDRIWFVAYCSSYGQQRADKPTKEHHRGIQEGLVERHEFNSLHGNGVTTYPYGIRLRTQGDRFGKSGISNEDGAQSYWQNFPTQSPVCCGNDGLSSGLDIDAVYEGVGKPRKSTAFGRWRKESIKGYGNAIVPQVAFEIFKVIEK